MQMIKPYFIRKSNNRNFARVRENFKKKLFTWFTDSEMMVIDNKCQPLPSSDQDNKLKSTELL